MPPWLATRMSSLGAVITQAIVHHYGQDEFLQRLSHPFWFQSFGAVMGVDWHSSGITIEHAAKVRALICPRLRWLGLDIDPKANDSDADLVSLEVRIIPTSEETTIARHVFAMGLR